MLKGQDPTQPMLQEMDICPKKQDSLDPGLMFPAASRSRFNDPIKEAPIMRSRGIIPP